jgi:hypothetical protein
MELGVLGSNKLVTTTNAIFTEIFTGIVPDKIVILSQDSHNINFTRLKEALRILGVNAEIEQKTVGEEFEQWTKFMENYSPDVLDITPGRKIMALSSIYSRAKEIRYIYLRREENGYRIFGWVPFSELKVYNIRTRDSITFRPPKTVNSGKVTLNIEGLTSLYNILSLNGEIEINTDYKDEEEDKICKIRSGILKFEEEDQIGEKIKGGDKIALDTNVYIKVGHRLGKYKNNIIPLRKVYDELESNAAGSRPDDRTKKFLLGLSSYRYIHNNSIPPQSNVKKGGDEGIIEEIKEKSRDIGNKWFVTEDNLEYEKANLRGINSIHLKTLRKNMENNVMGSYIQCLSIFSKVRISIKGEEVIDVDHGSPSDGTATVTSIEGFNYAEVISKIQEFLNQQNLG